MMSCDVGAFRVKVLFCLHSFLTKCGQAIVLVGVLGLPARVDASGTTVCTFDLIELVCSLLLLREDDLVDTIFGYCLLFMMMHA